MAILYAFTMAIVHACTMAIAHALKMVIVHTSWPKGVMFARLSAEVLGAKAPRKARGFEWPRLRGS